MILSLVEAAIGIPHVARYSQWHIIWKEQIVFFSYGKRKTGSLSLLVVTYFLPLLFRGVFFVIVLSFSYFFSAVHFSGFWITRKVCPALRSVDGDVCLSVLLEFEVAEWRHFESELRCAVVELPHLENELRPVVIETHLVESNFHLLQRHTDIEFRIAVMLTLGELTTKEVMAKGYDVLAAGGIGVLEILQGRHV